MGVTVGVLVLLIFTIQALSLFDRLMQRRQSAGIAGAVIDAPSAVVATPVLDEPGETTPGGEIIAVIGAALALAEEDESRTARSGRDMPAGTSPDAWAQAGRRQMMDRRGRPAR